MAAAETLGGRWRLDRPLGAGADATLFAATDLRDGRQVALKILHATLFSSDDNARRVSYSVVESPMGNLESHTATIAVDPEGSGSHVTWSVDVSPDDLLGLFVPVYEGSIVELKKKLEA